MAGKTCTCGQRFMDPEDWRDHMPCDGTEAEQLQSKLEKALERESILVAALKRAPCANYEWVENASQSIGDNRITTWQMTVDDVRSIVNALREVA